MSAPDREIVLRVHNVGKRFSRNARETQVRIAEAVNQAFWPWAPQPAPQLAREFWALKDISFDLRRGEAIGVIGLNGAGKTTLLRLLIGHVLPDAGRIEIKGKSGAMIDLAAGFQNNMTGRDNIFLRSATLGRQRSETERMLDDIIAFTELNDAIDAPLHTYSAGMKMRLAFATTVFFDPDVLIVDEVLSVGDFKFRQKCLERIRAMRQRCAFVLVSHSMGDILRFCERAIVLEAGRIAFQGAPAEAIAFYEQSRETGKKAAPSKAAANDASVLGHFFHNTTSVSDVEHVWIGENGEPAVEIVAGRPLELRVRFRPAYAISNAIIGVPIFTPDGRFVTSLSSEQYAVKLAVEPGALVEATVKVPSLALVPGIYRSVVAIVDGPEYLYRQRNADLTVKHGQLTRYFGDVVAEQDWSSRIVAD